VNLGLPPRSSSDGPKHLCRGHAGRVTHLDSERLKAIATDVVFDDAEIRAAERRLVAALEDPDPTAWVFKYTDDAVLDAGGEHAVQGREALLDMANAMQPLSSAPSLRSMTQRLRVRA
jgi:hypothetical protein